MTWTTHVWINSTMCTVRSSSHFRRSIHVYVFDDQTIDI